MKTPKISKIADLVPDRLNANRGTERGNAFIEQSLQKYGAGRSILLDKKGRIIAGNKTVENAGQIGLDDVLVVQSDGRKLIAVQRTDLDLEGSDPKARELAIADNRSSEANLSWSPDVLAELGKEIDLSLFWGEEELKELLTDGLSEGDGGSQEERETCPTCGRPIRAK